MVAPERRERCLRPLVVGRPREHARIGAPPLAAACDGRAAEPARAVLEWQLVGVDADDRRRSERAPDQLRPVLLPDGRGLVALADRGLVTLPEHGTDLGAQTSLKVGRGVLLDARQGSQAMEPVRVRWRHPARRQKGLDAFGRDGPSYRRHGSGSGTRTPVSGSKGHRPTARRTPNGKRLPHVEGDVRPVAAALVDLDRRPHDPVEPTCHPSPFLEPTAGVVVEGLLELDRVVRAHVR